MEDVYKTPESSLAVEAEHRSKPHWFWRLLFWLHVCMAPLLVMGLVLMESFTLFDYMDLATFPPVLVALYGFSYAKKIGVGVLWRAFSIFYPSWVIFYSVIVAFVLEIPQYGAVAEVDGGLILEAMFVVPTCFALWLYASSFNSNEKF